MFKVKRLYPGAYVPSRAHKTDSGLDLHLFSPNSSVVLYPGEYRLVSTGIAIELCHDELHWTTGFKMTLEAQIRPRSGRARDNGLSIVNTPGTLDNTHTGAVMVVLINLGNEKIELFHGDKIAQLVVCPVVVGFDLVEVDELGETDRGSKGFGSTELEEAFDHSMSVNKPEVRRGGIYCSHSEVLASGFCPDCEHTVNLLPVAEKSPDECSICRSRHGSEVRHHAE